MRIIRERYEAPSHGGLSPGRYYVEVEVAGKRLARECRIDFEGIPLGVIKRDVRRAIMQAIEKELFGD